MDLHTWITQQVDRAEASARAELEHRQVVFLPHNGGGPAITGVVTGTTQCADGIQLDVAQCGVQPRDGAPAPVESVAVVLRRCEADRRILARHRLDPNEADSPMYATACRGCERWGEYDYPNTDNLNDCPELLDLAHAHGITPEVLAALDQPQPPQPAPRSERRLGLGDILAATNPITTSDVPEALRGPRWKP